MKNLKDPGDIKFYTIPLFRLLHLPQSAAAPMALFFTPNMDSMRLEHLEVWGATVQGPGKELEKKPNTKNLEIKYPRNFISLR